MKGEFVSRNPAGNLRIPDLLISEAIQLIDRIETVMLHFRGDSRRIAQVEHRVALVSKRDTLIIRWQKSARPERGTAAQAAPCRQHHVSREVFGFTSQAVIDPRAHG